MHDLLQNNLIHRIYAFEAASRISPRGRAKTYPIAFVLDRIFFVCKTGCQWNQLPAEQCSYKTIFHYFSKWSKARLFEDAFYELAGRIQCERAIVDTSFVKNVGGQDVVGRNPTDRGRKATKVSMLTNELGTPLTLCFHRGNKSDMLTLKHLIDTCKRKTQCLQTTTTLLADKGYDSECNRSVCRTHDLNESIAKRGRRGNVPGRYVIEQTFGILDQYRRIRVRYETKIGNFKSFNYLACACLVSSRLARRS
jgi:putative transposase